MHLYRRDIFKKIDLQFTGIVMETEVVLKAHALGLPICEVPCPMEERIHDKASAGRHKIMYRTGLNQTVNTLWFIGEIKRNLNRGLLIDD